MKQELKDSIDKMNAYANIFKETTRWNPSITKMICSLYYISAGVEPNLEEYEKCKQYIIDNTDAFSFFRGDMSPYVATVLSCTPPQKRADLFDKIKEFYEYLRYKKMTGSPQLVCATLHMTAIIFKKDMERAIDHLRNLYDVLARLNPMNTNIDDYVGISVAATSDIPIDVFADRMSYLQSEFKSTIGAGKVCQLLSYTTMLAGEIEDDKKYAKDAKVIYLTMKSNKFDFKWYGNISIMGLLIGIDGNSMTDNVYDALEALKYAQTLPNFGKLALGDFEALMLVICLMVLNDIFEKRNKFIDLNQEWYFKKVISTMMVMLIAGTFAEEDHSRL